MFPEYTRFITSWKSHKDVNFRAETLQYLIEKADFEYQTWESDAVEHLRVFTLDSETSRVSTGMIERMLQSMNETKIPSVINAVAALTKGSGICDEDHFNKSYTDLEKEIDAYFASAFRAYQDQRVILSSDVIQRPISFVQIQDYGGLENYLKKHGREPRAYPIHWRGQKRDTVFHTAVRMKDWKSLKIILKYKSCDTLKRKCTDEGFNPLALFVLKYEEKERDIFTLMLNSCFDLLHSSSENFNSPLGILIRLSERQLKYLPLLEEALGFLKSQGALEKAMFETLEQEEEEEEEEEEERERFIGSGRSRISMMDINEAGDDSLPVGEVDFEDDESDSEDDPDFDLLDVEHDEEHVSSDHSIADEGQGIFWDESDSSDGNISDLLHHLNFRRPARTVPYHPRRPRRLRRRHRRSKQTLFQGALVNKNANAVIMTLNHLPLNETAKEKSMHWLLQDLDPYCFPIDILRIIFNCLLLHGANINGKSRRGATPLMTAVNIQNVNVVKILLDHGADTQLVDRYGNSAMTLARDADNTEIISMLESRRVFARLESSRSSNRNARIIHDGASAPTCVICLDRPAQVILAPCGHRVLCRRDCKRLFEQPEEQRRCPMDNEKIESFIVNVYDA